MALRNGPDWGSKGIKTRQTDGHIDSDLGGGGGGGLSCLLEKSQHPGNSAC